MLAKTAPYRFKNCFVLLVYFAGCQLLSCIPSKRLPIFNRLYNRSKSLTKRALLEEIYRQHRKWLLTLAYRLTGNWDLAADAVHDVFAKLLSGDDNLQAVDSLKNLLAKSVCNRALDYKRLAWYRLKGYLEDWEQWQVVFQRSYEEKDCIARILKKLTVRERAVLVLRDMEGYPVCEIAQMLNIKESTARVLSKTGRDKFIRLYKDEDR